MTVTIITNPNDVWSDSARTAVAAALSAPDATWRTAEHVPPRHAVVTEQLTQHVTIEHGPFPIVEVDDLVESFIDNQREGYR